MHKWLYNIQEQPIQCLALLQPKSCWSDQQKTKWYTCVHSRKTEKNRKICHKCVLEPGLPWLSEEEAFPSVTQAEGRALLQHLGPSSGMGMLMFNRWGKKKMLLSSYCVTRDCCPTILPSYRNSFPYGASSSPRLTAKGLHFRRDFYTVFPDAIQLPPGSRGKTLRGKVGWALCMFYNFTLKTALCVYITYFCATKLSRTFTRVWISPCGGKGECCKPTPCHQPESEQLMGKQNWTQRREGSTSHAFHLLPAIKG